MDTIELVRPPAKSPTAPKRRPWTWIAVVIAVAVLAGGGLWLARYQPLRPGSFGGATGPTGTRPSLAEENAALRYVDGQTAFVTVSVFNSGPLGVTVTGVDSSRDFSLIQFAGARLSDERAPTDPGRARPFRPFSLPPGHERGIVVLIRFANCKFNDHGSATVFAAIHLRFRVLGISRAVWFDLARPVEVKSPPDSECPARQA